MRRVAPMAAVVVLGAVLLAILAARRDPPASTGGDRVAGDSGSGEPAAVAPGPEKSSPPPPPAATDVPWTLEVAVVDPEDASVPGRRVIFRNDAGWDLAEGLTDEAGVVTLDVRGPGHLVVERKDGQLPACVEGLTRPPSGRRSVTVRLPRGLAIAGRVLAQDGANPAARARIQADRQDVPAWEDRFRAQVSAGEDGRFRIEGLPAGRYRLRVSPKHGTDDGAVPDPAPEVEAGDEDVLVRLGPRAVVTVKIREVAPGSARRTTGIRVEDDAGWGSNWGKTGGSQDEFTIALTPGRRYSFRVEVPGWLQNGTAEVDLRPEDRERDLTIEIRPDDRPLARLRLRIRTDTDEVPDRIQLTRRISSGMSTSEFHDLAEGVLTLELPPGRPELTVERPGRPEGFTRPWLPVRLETELEPGVTVEKSVVLRTGGWVRLRGQRLWRTLVFGAPEGEELASIRHRIAFDRDGHLLAGAPLAPGKWIVEIRPPRRPPVRHVVEVRPGKITEIGDGR